MSITFADPAGLSHDALEEGDRFAPRFDDKGLLTAITIEAATGAVLMVAHMNAAALTLTLETGEVQKLKEIRVDCDQDALLVLVEQTGRGAACHTGRKTCFYRRVAVIGGEARLEDTGEPRLFDPKLVYGR